MRRKFPQANNGQLETFRIQHFARWFREYVRLYNNIDMLNIQLIPLLNIN